jgi:hypothetical protein
LDRKPENHQYFQVNKANSQSFFDPSYSCKKRHDEFLKDMFNSDPNKERYQRKYEKELQALLEQMISQVDQKIKRSL